MYFLASSEKKTGMESYVRTDNNVDSLLYITLHYKFDKIQENAIWHLLSSM